jgi:hypothetical protein
MSQTGTGVVSLLAGASEISGAGRDTALSERREKREEKSDDMYEEDFGGQALAGKDEEGKRL